AIREGELDTAAIVGAANDVGVEPPDHDQMSKIVTPNDRNNRRSAATESPRTLLASPSIAVMKADDRPSRVKPPATPIDSRVATYASSSAGSSASKVTVVATASAASAPRWMRT